MSDWYVGMGFDPEVPAGYQDADIEMRELQDAADSPEFRAELLANCPGFNPYRSEEWCWNCDHSPSQHN